jgi:hypothetical protein
MARNKLLILDCARVVAGALIAGALLQTVSKELP